MAEEVDLDEIAAGIRAVLSQSPTNTAHAEALEPLLTATGSRAVGCWRFAAGHLELAGFLAVDDMPADVQAEFVAITNRVSLTQSRFGIVQAVDRRGPAINHQAENGDTSITGSIGWLGRFAAASSLAVPFYREGELQGALAVATKSRIEPEDRVWQLIQTIAGRLTSS